MTGYSQDDTTALPLGWKRGWKFTTVVLQYEDMCSKDFIKVIKDTYCDKLVMHGSHEMYKDFRKNCKSFVLYVKVKYDVFNVNIIIKVEVIS